MKDLRNLVAYYTNRPVLIEYNHNEEILLLHLSLPFITDGISFPYSSNED